MALFVMVRAAREPAVLASPTCTTPVLMTSAFVKRFGPLSFSTPLPILVSMPAPEMMAG